jgi:hypothetical protein
MKVAWNAHWNHPPKEPSKHIIPSPCCPSLMEINTHSSLRKFECNGTSMACTVIEKTSMLVPNKEET